MTQASGSWLLSCARRSFVVVALLLIASAGPARATSIDFLLFEPTPGTIFYSGGATPLFGVDIEVDAVLGNGTPANNGVFATCVNCALSFFTGNFVGQTIDGWVFAGGGSLSLTGGVDLTGNGSAADAGDIPEGTELLSGGFSEVPLVADLDPTLGSISGVAFAALLDFKSPFLTSYYGVAPAIYPGEMVLTFLGVGDVPGPFGSVALGPGFVSNKVPEPGSLALLALGVLAVRTRKLHRR